LNLVLGGSAPPWGGRQTPFEGGIAPALERCEEEFLIGTTTNPGLKLEELADLEAAERKRGWWRCGCASCGFRRAGLG